MGSSSRLHAFGRSPRSPRLPLAACQGLAKQVGRKSINKDAFNGFEIHIYLHDIAVQLRQGLVVHIDHYLTDYLPLSYALPTISGRPFPGK
jgi:hypothetical protein